MTLPLSRTYAEREAEIARVLEVNSLDDVHPNAAEFIRLTFVKKSDQVIDMFLGLVQDAKQRYAADQR